MTTETLAFEIVTGPYDDPHHSPVTIAQALDLIESGEVIADDLAPLVPSIDGMDPAEWLQVMTQC